MSKQAALAHFEFLGQASNRERRQAFPGSKPQRSGDDGGACLSPLGDRLFLSGFAPFFHPIFLDDSTNVRF